jgi:TonB-linked SusC/RagA family outer membrane protein
VFPRERALRDATERSGDVAALAVRALRSVRRRLAPALLLGLAASSTASAQTTGSYLDKPAHIRVYNVPLLDALRDLEQRAGVALAYSPSLLPAALRVTCACDNVTVRDALRILLVNTEFNFRESDNQILLYPVGQDVKSQIKAAANDFAAAAEQSVLDALRLGTTRARAPDSTTITGLVTSDAGTPIASALVTLPGLHRSTVTGENGVYRFAIPTATLSTRAETLQVARLGYKPMTRGFAISTNHVEIDVSMTTQVVALDQVLVTGTAGNQERGAQAAVIGTIDAVDIMSKAPAPDVNTLLYARMAGVSMTTASGTSGANTRIDIRGQASVSLSNYPLVFVDGVRILAGPRIVATAPGGTTFGAGGQQFSALNDLNPGDIESIEIVKGPAAATLYGADASAGVIQILTRKGRAGTRGLSQHISTEYDNIDPAFTPYTNYAKCTAALVLASSANPLCRGKTEGALVTDNVLVRNRAFVDGEMGSINYSAQGGGDSYGYFGSFSASNERGTSRQSFLNHRTGRMSMNLIASPRLTIDGSIGLVRSDDRLPQGDQSSYGYLLGGDLGSPLTVTIGPNGGLAGGWFNNNLNVHAISAITTEDNTLRATPSVQMRYAPAPWFTNRVTIGADVARTRLSQMFPRNDSGWYSSIANTGSVNVTDANTTIYTVDYLGNVNHRFGPDLAADLSFGSQWINTLNTGVSASGQGLLTNSNNLVSAATTTVAAESYGQTKSLGFIAQGQLGIGDRLYLQLGGRLDRNSAFGSKVGSFFLPKAGASWVVSQEPFWRNLSSVIPTMRLRAAYGTTGRSPSAIAALQTYSRANYLTDLGAILPGVAPGSPGNPNIKPERGTEFEAGIDAGFFSDRAGVEITYFNKTSKDLLLTQPIAPSSGFATSPLINVGEVENTGLEVSLRATPVDTRNVTLDATLNVNTLHNEIVNMGGITPFVSGNNQCFKPGVEIAAWCVPRVLSVDTLLHRSIVSDTAQVAGGQLPKLAASFASTLTLFRNLKLYGQVDGKFDYSVYNLTRDLRDRVVQPSNSADVNLPADQGGYSAYERQRRLGPFYAQTSGASMGAALVRGPYIVPGDFVRLRELALTMAIPSEWTRRVGVETSSIAVGGRNLALWTRYDGWDPEVIGVIDPATPFLGDVFTTPQARRAFVRLSVSY